jgi:hypothetical protein
MKTISKLQVIEAEQALLEAMKKNDIEQLEKLLHADLLFHLPTGQILTKEMDMQAHRAGGIVIDEIAASEQAISLFGDTAVVSVLIESTGKIFDQPMSGRFRYIRCWKLYDNRLQIIGGSCIQIPASE